MKSTVNAQDVTFSAGSRVEVGTRTTPVTSSSLTTDLDSLTPIGLLAANMTFNIEQTVRQKMDMFPEVVVAEAVQAQAAAADLTVREWTNDNLMLALGLEGTDTTDVAQDAGPPVTPAYKELPIGRRATVVYRIVRITEYLTNGKYYEAIFWKARVGARAAIQMNAVEEGADIPLIVQAIFEPEKDMLVAIRNYALPTGE
jgi:hypothetical protein